VHKREYRVEMVGKTGGRATLRIWERAWRDNRATAAKRRQKKLRGEM
jgi:hypothetical protein